MVSSRPSLYFLETPIWQSYCFWKSRLPICFQFSPWQKFPRLQSRCTSPRSLQNYFGLWFTRIWWFWTSKSFHRIPYSCRWLCRPRKFTYGLYSSKSCFYFSKKSVIDFFKDWFIESFRYFLTFLRVMVINKIKSIYSTLKKKMF